MEMPELRRVLAGLSVAQVSHAALLLARAHPHAVARASRLYPPRCHWFDLLSNELSIEVLARLPFMSHGTVRTVCKRCSILIKSEPFRVQRRELGYAEHGVVVAAGVRGQAGCTANCWMYTGGRWRPIAPLSAPRENACSAVFDGEMFVMGGEDDEGLAFLTTVEAYNPQTNTWRSCSPMSQGRSGAVAGAVGGSLVVCGGLGGADNPALQSAEAYTSETGWTPLPPPPHKVYRAAACVLDGKLYVVGSFDSNILQVWDGTSWTCKANLPTRRWDAAAGIAHDGKLMVIGGHVGRVEARDTKSDSVILYDPATDTWEETSPVPTLRGSCCATNAPSGGFLLFSADFNGTGEPPAVLHYEARAWSEGRYDGLRDVSCFCVATVRLG